MVGAPVHVSHLNHLCYSHKLADVLTLPCLLVRDSIFNYRYISLAPISWVVGGSRAFFAVACLLFQFFRSIDKKPEGLGYEDFQGLNI